MLATYGWHPGQNDNSNIAIRGGFDMPIRKGKTFQDWGKMNGVEPYVRSDELLFAGRDINLVGTVYGPDKLNSLKKVENMIKDINAFTGLVPLVSSKFGTWNVYVNGVIDVDYFGDGYTSVKIPFREPVISLPTTLPTPVFASPYGIDNYSFKDLGLTVLSMQSGFNRPAPKSQVFTAYQNEGFQITKTAPREITIKGFINELTYTAFKSRVDKLMALFTAPGTHTISKQNDSIRTFFIKDGFTLSEIYSNSSEIYAFIDFKITELNSTLQPYYLATPAGAYILTAAGQKILMPN